MQEICIMNMINMVNQLINDTLLTYVDNEHTIAQFSYT